MADKLPYSIVIPLYNKGSTIDMALDSIFVQDHDVEVIVVDDGSIDDGADRVKRRGDSRIKLIHQSNKGVSAARNRGIAESTNGLIALLDADDEWLPGFLNTIDDLVKQFPTAGAYTTSFQVINARGTITIKHPKIGHPFMGIPNYFHCVLSGNFFCASSIVVRKDSIMHIGGFGVGNWWGEDSDAWGRLAFYYDIAHSSEALVKYYQCGENHAALRRDRIEYTFADAANEYLKKNPHKRDRNLLLYANMNLYTAANRNIWAGYPEQARAILARRPSNLLIVKIFYCYFLSLIPPCLITRLKNMFWKIKGV